MRFLRIGRKYFSKPDWVEEFIHRLTTATMTAHEKLLVGLRRVSRDRRRQLAQADAILARAGI